MRGLVLIVLWIFTQSLFAQDLKIMSEPCEACEWPVAKEITPKRAKLACENLYQAACLDSAGKLFHKSKKYPSTETMEKRISDLRNKAIAATGAKDISSYITKELEKKGIKLLPDISEKAKKYFFLNDSSSYVSTQEIFLPAKECVKTRDKLYSDLYLSSENRTPEKAHQILNNAYNIIDAQRTNLTEIFSLAIPTFVDRLRENCRDLTSESKKELSEDEKKLKTEICDRSVEIRRHAIELYRNRDDKTYLSKAKSFIKRFVRGLKLSPKRIDPKEIDIAKIETEARNLQSTIQSNLCYDNGYSSASGSIRDEIKNTTAKSRVVVEGLIESVYSPARKAKLGKMLKMATSAIVEFLSTSGFKKEQIELIKSDYDKMELGWMEKPDDKMYVKDPKTGIEVLDPKIRTRNFGPGISLDSFEAELALFTTTNAFYVPHMTFGRSVNKNASINFFPVLLEMLDTNPWSVYEVFAHEAGHNIGPQLSLINGYDIVNNYEELLACYRSPESISLFAGQEDETISDYISSEVLALTIAQLPEDKKLAAIFASQEFGCIVESLSAQNIEMASGRDPHPAMFLRVAGIFGGSKSLRQIMKCEAESKSFRMCSLDGANK